LAAQAAQSELAQFRYLGFLSRNGQDEAFLSKGKELHIVRTGGMIEERVLVKAITPKDVTLQETKSQVEKTVLLASEGR
jgi:Tfp pilus assembly protein PilP